ncbi:hypothetical protein DFP72DRAFT_354785 [Ephemerocybe angulata]|uniref:F-box domain-containing protein n=1 Tax=Ephemerocybe angulata TaxID=980116 RepID=A0A8H6HYP9_9AGAR|nr:hypothetical protein DFP72DRAFT_354785 [Tulosesus angulatus]
MGVRIFSLPLEIHALVFLDLELVDLVYLGWTCRAFREIVSQRVVWENALRMVCARDGLFTPSYPFDEMDLCDLKRAALHPFQWNQRMLSIDPGEQGCLTPHREIPLPRDPRVNPQVEFLDAYILPGGRYVVGSSPNFITLWDLGPIHHSLEYPPRILDTIYDAADRYRISFPTRPSPHGTNCFRICAFFYSIEMNLRCLRVYEVGPLPRSTSFRLLGQLDTFGMAMSWLVGDCVVLETVGAVKWHLVWNVTRNLVTSPFELVGRTFPTLGVSLYLGTVYRLFPYSHLYLQWAVEGCSLLGLQRKELDSEEGDFITNLSAWRIPKLDPIEDKISLPLWHFSTMERIEPDIQVDFDQGEVASLRPDYGSSIPPMAFRSSSVGTSIFHLFLHSPDAPTSKIGLCTVAIVNEGIDESGNSGETTVRLLSHDLLRKPYLISRSRCRHYSVMGDYITSVIETTTPVAASNTRTKYVSETNLVHSRIEADKGSLGGSCRLATVPVKQGNRVTSLCTASGRMAHIGKSNSDRVSTVFISYFLAP